MYVTKCKILAMLFKNEGHEDTDIVQLGSLNNAFGHRERHSYLLYLPTVS